MTQNNAPLNITVTHNTETGRFDIYNNGTWMANYPNYPTSNDIEEIFAEYNTNYYDR